MEEITEDLAVVLAVAAAFGLYNVQRPKARWARTSSGSRLEWDQSVHQASEGEFFSPVTSAVSNLVEVTCGLVKRLQRL